MMGILGGDGMAPRTVDTHLTEVKDGRYCMPAAVADDYVKVFVSGHP